MGNKTDKTISLEEKKEFVREVYNSLNSLKKTLEDTKGILFISESGSKYQEDGMDILYREVIRPELENSSSKIGLEATCGKKWSNEGVGIFRKHPYEVSAYSVAYLNSQGKKAQLFFDYSQSDKSARGEDLGGLLSLVSGRTGKQVRLNIMNEGCPFYENKLSAEELNDFITGITKGVKETKNRYLNIPIDVELNRENKR